VCFHEKSPVKTIEERRKGKPAPSSLRHASRFLFSRLCKRDKKRDEEGIPAKTANRSLSEEVESRAEGKKKGRLWSFHAIISAPGGGEGKKVIEYKGSRKDSQGGLLL